VSEPASIIHTYYDNEFCARNRFRQSFLLLANMTSTYSNNRRLYQSMTKKNLTDVNLIPYYALPERHIPPRTIKTARTIYYRGYQTRSYNNETMPCGMRVIDNSATNRK
jgi:hypothetical protein